MSVGFWLSLFIIKIYSQKDIYRFFFIIMEDRIYWLLKSYCIKIFGDGKYGGLFSQKADENIIFIDYWKVLAYNFLEMWNTAFFWAKNLMERWYLLITERFLLWTSLWWEIRSFFQLKSWLKDDIYLVFLNFPLYSRNWEIWSFEQW